MQMLINTSSKIVRKGLLTLNTGEHSPDKNLELSLYIYQFSNAIRQLDKLNSFPAIAFELYSSMARALVCNPRVASSSLTIGNLELIVIFLEKG